MYDYLNKEGTKQLASMLYSDVKNVKTDLETVSDSVGDLQDKAVEIENRVQDLENSSTSSSEVKIPSMSLLFSKKNSSGYTYDLIYLNDNGNKITHEYSEYYIYNFLGNSFFMDYHYNNYGCLLNKYHVFTSTSGTAFMVARVIEDGTWKTPVFATAAKGDLTSSDMQFACVTDNIIVSYKLDGPNMYLSNMYDVVESSTYPITTLSNLLGVSPSRCTFIPVNKNFKANGNDAYFLIKSSDKSKSGLYCIENFLTDSQVVKFYPYDFAANSVGLGNNRCTLLEDNSFVITYGKDSSPSSIMHIFRIHNEAVELVKDPFSSFVAANSNTGFHENTYHGLIEVIQQADIKRLCLYDFDNKKPIVKRIHPYSARHSSNIMKVARKYEGDTYVTNDIYIYTD